LGTEVENYTPQALALKRLKLLEPFSIYKWRMFSDDVLLIATCYTINTIYAGG
jgi:hypothetical protein